MTEVPHLQNDKPMCVRIWLEVGHECEPRRSAAGRALALDWRVWVRGASGADISPFVHKVVFHLHPPTAFVYPKRVLQEPPYEIQESGCASIVIPIHVYLKYGSRPKKIRLKYSLQIENNSRSSCESRCVYYDFSSPSEELSAALMSGGGELVARAAGKRLLLVVDEERRRARPGKCRFVEPVQGKRARTKSYVLDELCGKCGGSTTADLRKQLCTVAMTDDEMTRVSQFYLACANYEKSAGALRLPPPADPIYRAPELPALLREALKAADERPLF